MLNYKTPRIIKQTHSKAPETQYQLSLGGNISNTAKMSSYSPAYPTNVQVDAGVKDFITKFYGVSDTPGKNQEWLDFFHDDATLVMALQEASGKTGECALRWP